MRLYTFGKEADSPAERTEDACKKLINRLLAGKNSNEGVEIAILDDLVG